MPLPIELNEKIIVNENDFNLTKDILEYLKHGSLGYAAKDNYWFKCYNEKNNHAIIKPNSVFWLYFWAETGQYNLNAALIAKAIFYKFFSIYSLENIKINDDETLLSKESFNKLFIYSHNKYFLIKDYNELFKKLKFSKETINNFYNILDDESNEIISECFKFFILFDTSLEKTGIDFRTKGKQNPIRGLLRPYECSENSFCFDSFKKVMKNLYEIIG